MNYYFESIFSREQYGNAYFKSKTAKKTKKCKRGKK